MNSNEVLEVDVETADSDCDTQAFMLLEELLYYVDQNCVQNCSHIRNLPVGSFRVIARMVTQWRQKFVLQIHFRDRCGDDSVPRPYRMV